MVSVLHECDGMHNAVWLTMRSCAQADEPVDPKVELEAKCEPKCTKFLKAYEACSERVQKKGDGECSGQYFEYIHCVDSCVSGSVVLDVRGAGACLTHMPRVWLQVASKLFKHLK